MSTRPRFAVVTDSAADLGPSRTEELGVQVAPLVVTIGDETFADGVLTQEELFRRINATPSAATTSQPSVGALVDAYGSALESADSVIALHVSSRISGTCETAELAARQFPDRVHVFDSRNLSWGLGWQVIDAVAAAREGLGVAETLKRLESLREKVKMVVTLDSLERLQRSGRISAAASRLGSILNLKVTVAVNAAGAFVPVRGNRGNGASLNSMLGWLSQHMGGATGGRFAVGHALAPERAQTLAEAIRGRWDVDELVMYEAGSVIATHAGTIWGTAVWPRS